METKDIVQHLPEESNDFYSDDDLFSISSWGADLSFRELIDRYDNDELVKPELQRKYVWDKIEASRFIDSILLGLPVPSVFLAKTQDEKMLIVDGYQRIMTVRDYVKGVFSNDGKAFRLSHSERINERWRGKPFIELSDADQRRIRNTTIHAIIFVQKLPPGSNTSLYQVFERINTSGRTLMPQEIRNCVYQGKLNDLFMKLNKLGNWRVLFGLEAEDSRMRDIELILRFFALSSPAFRQEQKERISLKKYLNVFMGANRYLSDADCLEFEQRFIRVMDLLLEKFGAGVFQNLSPTNPDKLVNKFSPTIFDSIAIAADFALSQGGYALPQEPEARRRDLLREDDYRRAISQETMTTAAIRLRIAKACNQLFGLPYE